MKDNTTPLMKQYHEIKEKYKNEILMFRLGDFYEMFFNDAIIASKVLGLTLTKRNREKGEDVPLAGVPYHSVSGYISKLVDAGYKVAICEQMEDPKLAKGIVKREVIKVITPGTVIDVENLDAKSNNYIACVITENDKAYFSYVDITTGVFNACIVDTKNINSLIYMLDVKELLMTKYTYPNVKEYLNGKEISTSIIDKPKNSVEFLSSYFSLTSLDSFGLDDKTLIDSCAGLLEYILETQINVDINIPKITVINDGNYAGININTSKNLELIKNQRDKTSYGSLLWVLDKCKTAMGTRLLKEYINYPLIDKDKIIERQKDVKYLIDNTLLREDLRENLASTYDMQRILSKIVFGNENAKDIRALYYTFKSYIKIIELWPEKFSSIKTDFLGELCNEIDRYLVLNPPFSVREGGMINENFNPLISELNMILKHGKEYLVNIEQEEKEKTGIKFLKIKYNKVFGYFIEVSKTNIKDVPSRYVRKQTLANCERYITEELKEYEDKIINAKARLVELEYNLFKELSNIIKQEKDVLLQLSNIVAYIDVMASYAFVSISNGYCLPEFNDEGVIHILNGRHPIVEQLISTQFIENDVHFTKEKNFIILTGPNMAGKSTYMKQIALICIMAQMGMYVPAKSANLCIVDKFLTRIGASDDILTGQSTFMVEMSEVSQILNTATSKSLIILDEVGRGTSTYDGMALATAISSYIHDNIRAKTIFATHYHELNELESKYERVVNYRINVEEKNSRVIFLRTITCGSADKSYGTYVAKLAGLPQSILRESKLILSKLEDRNNMVVKNENIGQLSLFDNPSYVEKVNEEKRNEELEELRDEIKQIDINNITPLKALNILQDLKDFVNNIE
ncbi:DNA mismatch repair protein MutS [Sneathia vaginalis]|uniref:DNA mismatch repair protein MutS n=1 Tax=Sneathia vaginalis TaxID=187101 RepID=UPI00370D772F